MNKIYQLITVLFIMPILINYAQFLKDERIKAQRYVDMLNNTRNHSLYSDDSNLRGFRSEWYDYEDEYQYNWDRG